MPSAGRDHGQWLGARLSSAQRPATHALQISPYSLGGPTSLAAQRVSEKPELQIVEWSAADIDPDQTQLGLQGSPTKVKRIENVVFQAKEAKRLEATDEALEGLIQELIAAHTIG